jgi:hypothetical protein
MQGKAETLIIRISGEDKKRVANAATLQGVSITEFVTRATLEKVKPILLKNEEFKGDKTNRRPTHGGVPTFFRALCLTASQGGAQNYKWVGFSFGQATEGEIPFDADWKKWKEMLKEVQKHITDRNHENVWLWYQETYPVAMALIPVKHRKSFVNGIMDAYDEGKLWFI